MFLPVVANYVDIFKNLLLTNDNSTKKKRNDVAVDLI